jgi:ElaA protein
MITIEVQPFDALSPRDVYDLLALRQRVFVVEQHCAFLDADGHDLDALHVLGRAGAALVACARILPRGGRFTERAIGRVAVAPEVRGRGVARALVIRALAAIDPPEPIALSAQRHLERFYASLGFVAIGTEYVEDGIPHVDMRRP